MIYLHWFIHVNAPKWEFCHIVDLHFDFWKPPYWLSLQLDYLIFTPWMFWGSSCPYHCCHYIHYTFLVTSILTEVIYTLSIVLICIFLTISEVTHFFIFVSILYFILWTMPNRFINWYLKLLWKNLNCKIVKAKGKIIITWEIMCLICTATETQ